VHFRSAQQPAEQAAEMSVVQMMLIPSDRYQRLNPGRLTRPDVRFAEEARIGKQAVSEFRIVIPVVVGSSPIIHPNYPLHLSSILP
jgi:hypothetical protein